MTAEENYEAEQEASLFECLEKIGAAHKNTNSLPDSDFEDFRCIVECELKIACAALGMTAFQTVLFADILCLYTGEAINFRELASYIKCSTVKLFRYLNELESIESRDYISLIRRQYASDAHFIDVDSDLIKKILEYKSGGKPLFAKTWQTCL